MRDCLNEYNTAELDNESLEMQILRLIRKFYCDYKVYNFILSENEQEEWLDVAYLCVFSKLKNYNPERSKLSTYVYYILKRNMYIIYYQVKYNISATLARRLFMKKKDDKENFDKILNICSTASLSTSSELIETNNTITNDRKDTVSFYADNMVDNMNVEEYVESNSTVNHIKQLIQNGTRKSIGTDNSKQILLDYIDNDCNSKVIQQKYNISRQRVDQLVRKLRNLLVKNGITLKN